MSWAAHQFEIYAVQAHLPKKMRGKVSFIGIFLGDFTPDFLSKFWVYGITIGGHHYGADSPHQWHRGWPGMGFTHTMFLGAVLGALLWLWKRSRALTVGYVLGFAAHVLTDVNDSVGTMLLFPFTTLNWTLETWAYAATTERRQVPRRRCVLQQPRPRDGSVLVRRRALLLARPHPRVLAHPDRSGRPAHLVVAGPAHARARAARALPRHLLLRGLSSARLDRMGPRVRPAGHRRRRADRLPVRLLLDRAVVARRPVAAARPHTDRAAP